jgi:DNA polymerase-1
MRTYVHRIAGEPVNVHIPEDAADLAVFLEWAEGAARLGPLALDTETTGLDIFGAHYRLRTVQFGTRSTAYVIHWERGGRFQEAALKVLRNAHKFLIHNAPFDWLVLDRHAGIPLESLAPRTLDTKVLASLRDPRQVSEGGVGQRLKQLCAYFVDPAAPDTQEDLTAVFNSLGFTKVTGWAGISLDHPTYNLYAGLDVILGSRIAPVLVSELDRLGVRDALRQYEHVIARICAVMQRKGMVLDADYTRELDGILAQEAQEWGQLAARYGVENVNSTDQIAEALAGMGEVLAGRTKTGKVQVNGDVLRTLADVNKDWEQLDSRTPNPLAMAVLRSKRAGKWRTTYTQTFLGSVDSAGRIHPNINTLQARTGRMSITKPAVQTLPSSDQMIRRCLLAEEGHVMVSTDFQAIELRVLAALADVRRMRDAIAADEDLHNFTASLVYGEDFTPKHRKLCKGVGLGKVYGGGAVTLSQQTGAPLDAVRHTIATFDRIYPEIGRASRRWQREAFQSGMVLVSPTGRRLPLDRDRTYTAVNYMCQSTARDCLGQALIDMEAAGLLDYLRLPIHDEVLASVPVAEAESIAREIERCMSFDLMSVPIAAEAEIGGRSWGSLYGADF